MAQSQQIAIVPISAHDAFENLHQQRCISQQDLNEWRANMGLRNRIVQETQPDEMYNIGAQSHVAVSFDSAEYTADVDGVFSRNLIDL